MTTPLSSRGAVTGLLERYGLRPDKSFGQNFLVDAHVLNQIVAAADIQPGQTVVEFGPGLGVLTRELAAAAGQVIAVELDRRMLPVLAETTGQLGNVTLIHGDALEFDWNQVEPGAALVANLPYNVGTRLVTDALSAGRVNRIVVMVQREVAERMRAMPGDPAYGALSVFVRHFASSRIVRDVPPGCFLPPPEVTSSVVRLDVHPDAAPDPELFRVVRQSFAHRRKTLRRNLMMAGYSGPTVLRALDVLQLNDLIRAEQLSLDQFRLLCTALADAG